MDSGDYVKTVLWRNLGLSDLRPETASNHPRDMHGSPISWLRPILFKMACQVSSGINISLFQAGRLTQHAFYQICSNIILLFSFLEGGLGSNTRKPNRRSPSEKSFRMIPLGLRAHSYRRFHLWNVSAKLPPTLLEISQLGRREDFEGQKDKRIFFSFFLHGHS